MKYSVLLFLLAQVFVESSGQPTCLRRQLTTIGGVKVYKVHLEGTDSVIAFQAKLAVDADGSPRAYGPGNSGLDYTANAGKTGNWWGVVTDNGNANGTPVVQGDEDPNPGMYISPTSLQDTQFGVRDTHRYVNSEIVPYIALPTAIRTKAGIGKGDLCWVVNTTNNKSSFAIYADSGPAGKLGEGSVELSKLLGLSGSPRNGGTSDPIILYIVFPGSSMGASYIPSVLQIHDRGIQLLSDEHRRLLKDTCTY